MLNCQMSMFYLHMYIFYSTGLLKKRKHPFLTLEAFQRSLYCMPKYSKAVCFLTLAVYNKVEYTVQELVLDIF